MRNLDFAHPVSGKVDYLERISRFIVLTAFGIAVLAFILAPLLAIAWQQKPFPGFLIDQTLVVNASSGNGWGPQVTGINYPERVTRVAGQRVTTAFEFDYIMSTFQVGDRIQIFTGTREGMGHLHPGIRVMAFPSADFLRMFWLPYLVGVAYLAVGIWIYRLRGATRPGRALSFFCVVVAVVNALIFDVNTTHVMSFIWTLAMAQIGGALISLAWRFPEEWYPVRFQPAILAVPYLISIGISIWAIFTLYDQMHPWAYVHVWEACQRYAGLGSVFFVAVMIYRSFAGHDATIRRQARLIVAGSILAFLPITVWFIGPLFNLKMVFEPILFLPGLIIFPVSIALAILKFRLWDVDEFVNYAFVYGASTAILAGVFAALSGLTQRLFVLTTGAKSDAALIITTLIIATVFTPLKGQVQKFVDRYLGEAGNNVIPLRTFGEEVDTFVQMQDVVLLSKRLLLVATQALDAEAGIVSLLINGRVQPIHIVGQWKDKVGLSVPLEAEGKQYGLLQLGPHCDRRTYSDVEGESVRKAAEQVARAIQLAWPQYIDRQHPKTDNLEGSASDAPILAAQGQVAPEQQLSGF